METFNFRNPNPGEVNSVYRQAKLKRSQIIKYKLLKQLLDGQTVDLTQSPQLFEALNREKMEFESIMALHPEQVNEALEATKEDRELMGYGETTYNKKSPAGYRMLGHIPPCVYNARSAEYWADSKLLKNFFNTFTKFRISTNRI